MPKLVHRRLTIADLPLVEIGKSAYTFPFPELCAGCSSPDFHPTPLQATAAKQDGSVVKERTVLVTIPLCAECQDRSSVGGMGMPIGCGILLFFGLVGLSVALAPASFTDAPWGPPLATGLSLALGVTYAAFMVHRKRAKVLDPAWFGAPRCALQDVAPVTDLFIDIPNEDFARQAQELNPALDLLPSERKLDTVDGRVAGTHHALDITAAVNARVTETLKARQQGDGGSGG